MPNIPFPVLVVTVMVVVAFLLIILPPALKLKWHDGNPGRRPSADIFNRDVRSRF